MNRLCLGLLSLLFAQLTFAASEMDDWFEALKKEGDQQQIYDLLYAMPKGADLHNHASGAVFSEWWYDLAIDQAKNGYIYYTKTRINNCKGYGGNEFGSPYLMYFINIQGSNYDKLSECEKSEYKALTDLTDTEKQAWLNSIRLDKPYEGRDEFFQTHWQRLGDLTANPYIAIEGVVRNMKAFAAEGLIYLEPDFNVFAARRADGSRFDPEQVLSIVRERLARKDVLDTGVTVRFQAAILRFLPSATDDLIKMYEFVASHGDLFVGVDMVGREDNDKGYPLRFLSTLRELRRQHHGVRLSIHAGEVDEPNHHVRDTLLLGAERIGHGVNLITDGDLMIMMRGGPYLIEINLISNLLLGYVDDFSQHPFPEYLRMGIPVALSTDDRGMWDSNMTDEFYVAVKEFNLSWDEIKLLSRNSLKWSFADHDTRLKLQQTYEKRISAFEKTRLRHGLDKISKKNPVCHQFIRNQYNLCRKN